MTGYIRVSRKKAKNSNVWYVTTIMASVRPLLPVKWRALKGEMSLFVTNMTTTNPALFREKLRKSLKKTLR